MSLLPQAPPGAFQYTFCVDGCDVLARDRPVQRSWRRPDDKLVKALCLALQLSWGDATLLARQLVASGLVVVEGQAVVEEEEEEFVTDEAASAGTDDAISARQPSRRSQPPAYRVTLHPVPSAHDDEGEEAEHDGMASVREVLARLASAPEPFHVLRCAHAALVASRRRWELPPPPVPATSAYGSFLTAPLGRTPAALVAPGGVFGGAGASYPAETSAYGRLGAFANQSAYGMMFNHSFAPAEAAAEAAAEATAADGEGLPPAAAPAAAAATALQPAARGAGGDDDGASAAALWDAAADNGYDADGFARVIAAGGAELAALVGAWGAQAVFGSAAAAQYPPGYAEAQQLWATWQARLNGSASESQESADSPANRNTRGTQQPLREDSRAFAAGTAAASATARAAAAGGGDGAREGSGEAGSTAAPMLPPWMLAPGMPPLHAAMMADPAVTAQLQAALALGSGGAAASQVHAAMFAASSHGAHAAAVTDGPASSAAAAQRYAAMLASGHPAAMAQLYAAAHAGAVHMPATANASGDGTAAPAAGAAGMLPVGYWSGEAQQQYLQMLAARCGAAAAFPAAADAGALTAARAAGAAGAGGARLRKVNSEAATRHRTGAAAAAQPSLPAPAAGAASAAALPASWGRAAAVPPHSAADAQRYAAGYGAYGGNGGYAGYGGNGGHGGFGGHGGYGNSGYGGCGAIGGSHTGFSTEGGFGPAKSGGPVAARRTTTHDPAAAPAAAQAATHGARPYPPAGAPPSRPAPRPLPVPSPGAAAFGRSGAALPAYPPWLLPPHLAASLLFGLPHATAGTGGTVGAGGYMAAGAPAASAVGPGAAPFGVGAARFGVGSFNTMPFGHAGFASMGALGGPSFGPVGYGYGRVTQSTLGPAAAQPAATHRGFRRGHPLAGVTEGEVEEALSMFKCFNRGASRGTR